jgi:hypothetical protein
MFLFNADTWENNEGGYCIWACSGHKPPLVSPNSPPSHRNISRKIGTVTEKSEFWQNRARRWIRFSLLMEPVKKLRDFFVLHPVMEKNLSRFFKIRFSSAHKSLCKLTSQNAAKAVFLGGRVVFRTPLRW